MQASWLYDLIQKHASHGAVIDSNLLLLLVIGQYNQSRILTFKNTCKYTLKDYNLVIKLTAKFHRRIVTPNIITEVDNLCRQIATKEYDSIAQVMRTMIAESFEIYHHSREAVQFLHYGKFGVTDSINIHLSQQKHLIVTDDYPLWGKIIKLGGAALNINHIRKFS